MKRIINYILITMFSINLVSASIITDMLGTKDKVSTLIEENIYSCSDNVTKYVTMATNSMGKPFTYYHYGDNEVKISDLKVNDVITYQFSWNEYAIHHRVVGFTLNGVITKGDTNNIDDEHIVTNDYLISRDCIKGGLM